jgi:hypothetical protein
MPTTPTEQVTSWIRSRLNDLTDEGSITRIDLHHAVEGEGSEMMCAVRVSDDADPFDVAQEIWDAADADTQTRMSGRMQRYVMLAYRGDAEQPDARMPFLLNGQAQTNLMGGDTEGASATGHMGQLMRHTERLHTSIMQLTEMTAGRLARDLEAERKIRLKLEDERSKSIEAIQDLADRKHERDLENKREAAKAVRHDQILALLMSMAPLMASKFLQAPTGPQLPAAGARDETVHQLLKNLTEDEAMKVMSALKPQNQLVLMELYKAHKEMEEDKDKSASPEDEK